MSERENAASNLSDLVVIGSSAGGIEALSVLVSTLPLDFPAPIVLAQHLDPNRESTLHLILQRHTRLPVELITSKRHLEPGNIYVVPANSHVIINEHTVEIQGDHDHMKRPRPSVDLLLSTAAKVYGEHLTAVILTGFGSDGATGAVDVKNAGGTVIVQNPQTARYPSMPLALPPTAVDFEANIEQIGPLLYDLLIGVNVAPMEERTEDILHDILEQVSQQASIDFRSYKTSTIIRRIGRRMVVTHTRTMRDYLAYLQASPEEIGELVKAFLINVTQFFRDPEAFAYLEDEILPKLINQAREYDRNLRFWAAGCATGEEAYSLAMQLIDALEGELSAWSIKIFATDLDEAAISFARRGLYTESMLKGISAEYRERFFERVDAGYRVSKALRQVVIFGQQDLGRSAPFPRIDLVLCRNVLIYFTPELQDYVLNQFTFSLYPDGYLFLGKAETVRPAQKHYELINKHWKIYRCVGNSLPSAPRLRLQEKNMPHPGLAKGNGSLLIGQEAQPPTFELGQLRHFNEGVLRFLPLGVVVIDRNYHILTANGAARRLLGLRDISSEQDFLHAVRGVPYATTRTAIDTVFRERNVVTLSEVELDIASGGNGRFINLALTLMQGEAGSAELAAISVTDVTDQVQTRRQLEAAQAEQVQLMNELGTANKRLSDVNKELLDSNEELQVANEELMLTHEELQASIEEFETTNEELQATNEELETNNEELQATNEELETTNEELRARTGEIQELVGIRESERARFAEMVELSPFYILVLRGYDLLVETYNPRYAPMLEGRLAQGRPLDEVAELFWDASLGMTIAALAREVYQQDKIRSMSSVLTATSSEQSERTSYFVYTFIPSHDASGKVNGVLVYATDETEQRTREAEAERERLKLIFDHTSVALLALYDAQSAQLVTGNTSYLDTVMRTRNLHQDELDGSTWHDLNVVASDGQADELWKKVLEDRTTVRIPELARPSGSHASEKVWDYSLTPILDSERPDSVRYVLVSAVEITKQVQVRKELERLDALKDDFLSLATHELRTPLTAMLGNAQILQMQLRRQTKELESGDVQMAQLEQEMSILEKIIYQIRRMNTLIGEMLDVTRMRGKVFELHNKEAVNVVELVRRAVEQQNTHDQRIIVNAPEEGVPVTIDENRIEQVLNNLLSNAIKYSPADTTVTVTVECNHEKPNEVVISIRDEGAGISDEEQAHIFDRFYRAHNHEYAKVEGLGLGLYIAHEIVIQQGGRMWLKSQLGKGSTFYFSLPLTQA